MKKIINFVLLSFFVSLFFVSCPGTASAKPEVNSLVFEKDSIELMIGDSVFCPVKISPENTDAKVNYSFSTGDVIEIGGESNKGCTVTAKGPGSEILIAKAGGLTAYLEIKVTNKFSYQNPYIVLPFSSVELEKGRSVSIMASLFGGDTADNQDFVWKAESNNITCESTGNVCVVQAVREGISKLTVSHKKSKYSSSVLIIIPSGITKSPYITTKSNTVKVYKGNENQGFNVEIKGGSEEMLSLTSFTVKEGSQNITLSYSNGRCNINALNLGQSVIEVSNPYCSEKLEVMVIVSEITDEGIIVSDTDFILLDKGESTSFNVRCINVNDTENTGNFTASVNNEEICEAFANGGVISVWAKKEGNAIVTVNYEGLLQKEILVVVEDNELPFDKFMITSSTQVVRLSEGDPDFNLKVSLTGGNESDKNSFSFVVGDSQVIDFTCEKGNVVYERSASEIPVTDDNCVIKPLKSGVTQIKVSHPKCPDEYTVNVIVYPKGTFDGKTPMIYGEGLVKVLKNETKTVNIKHDGTFQDLSRINYESYDENIINVKGNGFEIVLSGIEKGSSVIRISSPEAAADFYFTAVCVDSYEEETDTFYFEKNYFELSLDANIVIDAVCTGETDRNSFAYSINGESVEMINSSNHFMIKGIKQGLSEITVLNTSVPGIIYKLKVNVEDKTLTIDYPYSISCPDFIGVVVNQNTVFEPVLLNAPEREYENLSFDFSGCNFVQHTVNNGSVIIQAESVNEGYFTVSHPKSKYKKNVYLYSKNTQEELDNNVFLFSSTPHDNVMEKGKSVYIEIDSNKKEILNDIQWSLSDMDSGNISGEGKGILFTALSEGTVTVYASYQEYEIHFFFTVKEIVSQNVEMNVPKIIEMVRGEKKIIQVTSDDYKGDFDLSFVQDNYNVNVSINNNTIMIDAVSNGSSEITVYSSRFGIRRKIYVSVCENENEFKNNYIMSLENSFMEIEIGNCIFVPLQFGNYIPDNGILQNIQWVSNDPSVCFVSGNTKGCYITGVTSGQAVIKGSCEGILNDVTLIVKVNEKNSPYFISGKRILKIKTGETKDLQINVCDSEGRIYSDYTSKLEISGVSSDCISCSLNEGNIHIVSMSEGECLVSVMCAQLGIDFKLNIITKNDVNELENIFMFSSYTDSYYLRNNEEIVLNLLFDDENDERINQVSWEITKGEAVELLNDKGAACNIKACKYGNAVIRAYYEDYEFLFNVTVGNQVVNNIEMYTQNVLVMTKGTSSITNVLCNDDVFVSECTEGIQVFETEVKNQFTVYCENEMTGEIVFESKGNKRYLKVISVNENTDVNTVQAFNIEKRNYEMKLGMEINIPVYSQNISSEQIDIEDVYGNGCINFETKNGILYAKAVRRGSSYYDLQMADMQKVRICFNVVSNIDGEYEITSVQGRITSDRSMVYIDDVNDYQMLYVSYDGDISDFSNQVKWETSDESLLKLDVSGSACQITALKDKGLCTVTVSHPMCANIYIFTVRVGNYIEIDDHKTNYIYVPQNTVTLEYGKAAKIIECDVVGNIDPEAITLNDSKTGIIKFTKSINQKKLIITVKPMMCGTGRITIGGGGADFSSFIDYIVTDSGESGVCYLTTSDNCIMMKKGGETTFNVSLVNPDDGDYYSGFNVPDFDDTALKVVGKNGQFTVQALKDGRHEIKITNMKADNEIMVTVFVSDVNQDLKYITTSSNLIETEVSSVMDSFMVNIVGINQDSVNLKYKSSDYEILSVVGEGNMCFYRGLKEGQAQIIINVSDDASVIPLTVNVIVTANNKEGYLRSEDGTVFYMQPNGNSRRIKLNAEGIEGFKNDRLMWNIYSQMNMNESSGNVIEIQGSGNDCIIYPKSEGMAKLRAVYGNTGIKIDFAIFVSTIGSISFTDSKIEITEGENYFENINVPFVSGVMDGMVTYSSDNSEIADVFGTSKVCLVEAKKEGTAIITARNSYDNTSAELSVKVLKKDDRESNVINVSRSTLLLNPRSSEINLTASIAGPDILPGDENNIQWTVKGDNKSVKIYPSTGPEVILSLIPGNDGKVNTGNAFIEVSHTKATSNTPKQVFVSVVQPQNYFTLSESGINIDSGSSASISANITGASQEEYDNVQWSIEKQKVNEDGTVTRICQLLNTTGKTCRIMGIEEGQVTLNCFYKGDLQSCSITVKGNRYFSLVSNSITMYPGQKYPVAYNLRPKDRSVTWFSSCNGQVIQVDNDDPDKQEVTLLAVNEGSATLTGLVNGVGTVMLSVRVVYDPKLVNVDKKNSIFIKMFDEGTADYNTFKNQEEFNFYCYPAEYYVKAEVTSSNGSVSTDFLSVNVEMDHNTGYGKVICKANRQIPKNLPLKVTLKQYKDYECTKPAGSNGFNFNISSGFQVKKGSTYIDDNSYNVYFKRYDGFLSLYGVQPPSETNDLVPLYVDGKVYNENFVLSDGETHYIIVKPKHKGQYCDFSYSFGDNPFIVNSNGTLRVDNDGVYTIEFNTGGNTGNYDIGWNAVLNGDTIETIPSDQKSDSNIYPVFALKDLYLENIGVEFFSSEIEYHTSGYDDSGYKLLGDSFFSSYSNDLNYSEYCCGCERLNHGKNMCKHRHVLLSFYTDIDNEKEYKYKSYFNDYVTMIYISDGKPTEQQYTDVLYNLFTANSNYNFKLLKSIEYNDGGSSHGYWYVNTHDIKMPLQLGEELLYNSKDNIHICGYESDLYQEYLWGNTSIGRWYPSSDITLKDYKENINFEIYFTNGDTNYENNVLSLKYKQKYAYCSHNLYSTNWETRSVYHRAEGYYNTIYDNELYDYHSVWVETKPSWTENIRKYYFDCNRNYITNDNFSKKISK